MKKLLSAVLVLFLAVSFCSCTTAKTHPETFGIYISSINGDNFKQILSDPYREMNHVRVSPDREKITFTRFNKRKALGGLAEEDDGYLNTQIMIANTDGTGAINLTPEGEHNINVNSYWTPDGNGLVYMSNDNPDKRTITLKHININTRKITTISPPSFSWVSDPHQVGERIVFPAAKNIQDIRAIWDLNFNSKEVKQLTYPKIRGKGKTATNPPPGDSDPKLSPDGKKLALTRHHGDLSFENIIVDLETGKEKSLSSPGVVDVMPEWSSDGKLLTFWHVDMKTVSNVGIYTVKPNGDDRRKIPLPPGYHFKMPAFFPGDGSKPEARIIFSGKYVPQIR